MIEDPCWSTADPYRIADALELLAKQIRRVGRNGIHTLTLTRDDADFFTYDLVDGTTINELYARTKTFELSYRHPALEIKENQS